MPASSRTGAGAEQVADRRGEVLSTFGEEPSDLGTGRHWVVSALAFGMPVGPLVSSAFDHGNPTVLGAIFCGALAFAFAAMLARVGVVAMGWRWHLSALRVALALSFGSALFLLPDWLALPVTGDFWWRTGLERFAVCCIPYPLLARLVMPHERRWRSAALCAGVAACLVLAWPSLANRMLSQTATEIRHEIGAPDSMLYTVDIGGVRGDGGFSYSDGAADIGYDVAGYVDAAELHPVAYLGYDLTLTVFPVESASPCSAAFEDFGEAAGLWNTPPKCSRGPDGRWQYTDVLGDETQMEIVGGDYVALTVTFQAPRLKTRFGALFASLHHPDTAELVTLGAWSLPTLPL